MSSNPGKQEKNRIRGLTSLFRGRRRPLEIDGYHVGEVRSSRAVVITETGAVAGNIYAEQVEIAGLVYGQVTALQTNILPGGQVWGDVFSGALHVEPGGKVHGWHSTIDEDGYLLLTAGEGNVDEVINNKRFDLPEYLIAPEVTVELDDDFSESPDGRLLLLRRLQAEAAAAVMSRAELENRFDEAVAEAAVEKIAEAAAAREEITLLRAEILSLGDENASHRKHLEERDALIADVNRELAEKKKALQESSDELLELKPAHNALRAELAKTREDRDDLLARLQLAQKRITELNERVENLESALQSSLQRAVEQESALLRWQELADVTETRVTLSEAEVESLRARLQERDTRTAELEEERAEYRRRFDEAAEALADRNVELDELQKAHEALQAAHDALSAQVSRMNSELAQHRERAEVYPQNMSDLKKMLEKANRRTVELEEELLAASEQAQSRYERLLWVDASHRTAVNELEEARDQLQDKESKLEALQKEIAEQSRLAEKWKVNVDRTLELLNQTEERNRLLEVELSETQGLLVQDINAKRVKQLQMVLDANEAELQQYITEFNSQGKRLTELQSALVERELALERARQVALQQSQEIKRVKKQAAEQIRRLGNELVDTRKKLRDVIEFLDRRHRRDAADDSGEPAG